MERSLGMIEVENIDSLLPNWLHYSASLRAVEERVEKAKDQVLRRTRQARDFADKHQIIAMFLPVVALLSFLPIFVFVAIVFSSFAVILFTSSAVFLGVTCVSLFPFSTVLIPILMIGGTTAVFIYFAYRSVVKMLEVAQRLKEMVMSLQSQIFGGSFGLGCDRKVKQPEPVLPEQVNREDVVPTDEEFFDEEFYYGSDSE